MSLDLVTMMRLASRIKGNPLLMFRPSPAMRAVMSTHERRLMVRAANRVGKSRHMAARLAQMMLDKPGLRCRAVAVNYQQSIKVISKYLYEFIPPKMLEANCYYTETRGWTHNLVRLRNGSTCQIMSSDQAPIAHAGDSLDIVWIDEVPPPEILDENIARVMDRNGAIWITATPIGRPVKWLQDLVNDPASPWVEHVVTFSHANCPWYTAEQCKTWMAEASASPWSYEQRINGAWEGVSIDRIFTGFCEASILAAVPDEQLHIGIGLDHGELSGHEAAVLIAWNKDICVAFDEYVSTDRSSIEEDCKAVLEMLSRHGLDLRHVSRIVGDVNSAGKAAIKKGAGHTVNEMFEDAFFDITKLRVSITTPSKGPGSVDAGQWVINHALMQQRLYTTVQTATLNRELRYYNGKSGGHIIDALRYVAGPILEDANTDSPGYLYRSRI